jgi:hypothetical protein
MSAAEPLEGLHPELVSAQRNVALAKHHDKLQTLHDAALRIAPLVVSGEILKTGAPRTAFPSRPQDRRHRSNQ